MTRQPPAVVAHASGGAEVQVQPEDVDSVRTFLRGKGFTVAQLNGAAVVCFPAAMLALEALAAEWAVGVDGADVIG